MSVDFGIWRNLSQGEIASMIDSKVKSIEELSPSFRLIDKIGDREYNLRVLDFGCGVGRNIIGMPEKWKVFGYDNPLMTGLAKEYILARSPERNNIFLFNDWDNVKKIASDDSFDMVFCCFVLQHIPETQLREYLIDFKSMARELFIFGRRALDPNNTGNGYDGGKVFKSVWEIILESGYEMIDAQKGLVESSDGNDHHWVRFKQKEKIEKGFFDNVRQSKRKRK